MRGGGSMQDARHREGKFRNDRLKRRAVLGHHLVFAAHGANRRGQRWLPVFLPWALFRALAR